MRITIGRVVIVLGLIAAAAGIAWSVLPQPIPVETAMVTKGRFVASVDEDGKTRIRERYVVVAPLAGRLARTRLKVGDQVGADDVVATIAPSPAPFLDPRSRAAAMGFRDFWLGRFGDCPDAVRDLSRQWTRRRAERSAASDLS